MTNVYINDHREAIKEVKTDLEMNFILNKVYDDGYNDGVRECKEQLCKIRA